MSPKPHITFLPPPGPSVFSLRPNHPTPPSSPPPPALFRLAHAVRIAVYVDEQNCSAANEIDPHDPVSWHWIAFAPAPPGVPVPDALDPSRVGVPLEGEIAAATIRLVPVSATPDAHADAHADGDVEQDGHQGPLHRRTRLWDGQEPHIKLGRLATVPSRRGLGLGNGLVEAALAWAAGNQAVLRAESGGAGKGAGGDEHEGEREDGRGGGNGWDGLVLARAQVSAERFWARAGFVTDPGLGTWVEAGIEHVAMWRRVSGA